MNGQDKNKEKKFFDNFAGACEYDVFTGKGYERLMDAFRILLSDHCRGVILDLGCGTGAFTKLFAGFMEKTVGMDISYGCVHRAHSETPAIPVVNGDMENLPFRTGGVEYVVFTGVLHHFKDYTPSLREAWRVLKHGGLVLAFEPNKWNPFMWLYRSDSSPFHSRAGKTDNEQLISPDEIKYQLMHADFRNIRVQTVSGVPFKYVAGNLARRFLPVYNFLDALFGVLPGTGMMGTFIVCSGTK